MRDTYLNTKSNDSFWESRFMWP